MLPEKYRSCQDKVGANWEVIEGEEDNSGMAQCGELQGGAS
jgi:hypothetical protein